MDSKKIRMLLRVVEAGSMMGIAEKEGYTPSGLTHMMTSIEQELDIKLLTRSNRGVRLTREGEKLLPYLKRLVAMEDTIHSEIARIKTKEGAVIRIGAYASIAKNWMPGIMREFGEQNPGAEFELTAFGRPDAYRALESGKVDIVLAGDDKSLGFEFVPLKKDRYYAVLPLDSPYRLNYRTFPIELLEKAPFIMPSFKADTEVKQVLSRFKINTQPLALVADNTVIVNMVASGLGISILSELVLRGNKDNVLTIPIKPHTYRVLGIATRPLEEMSELKKKFISFVKERKL